jgi:hypothetical protein
LNVTLELSEADLSDLGTVNLNTSLSALSAMGIDTITGDSGTSVVVQGGIGDMTLSQIMDLGLNFADGADGGSDLFVTLDLTDAESSMALGTSDLENLRDMGIDFINSSSDLIDLDTLSI